MDRMSIGYIGCCQQRWGHFTYINRHFFSRNLYKSNIGIPFGSLPSTAISGKAGNQIWIWTWNLANWQRIPDFLDAHVIPYHPLLMAFQTSIFTVQNGTSKPLYTSYTRLCPHVATYGTPSLNPNPPTFFPRDDCGAFCLDHNSHYKDPTPGKHATAKRRHSFHSFCCLRALIFVCKFLKNFLRIRHKGGFWAFFEHIIFPFNKPGNLPKRSNTSWGQ